MPIASDECLRAVGLHDSDSDEDAVGLPKPDNVADTNTIQNESTAQPKSDIGCVGSTPLTLGTPRCAMKRSIHLIWGARVGNHLGFVRGGRIRFEDENPPEPKPTCPTNLKSLDAKQKSNFVESCQKRCDDLPVGVRVDWGFMCVNKDMLDFAYVAEIARGFLRQGLNAKCGITTCAAWRMHFCDGHNDGFIGYYFDNCTAMFPIVEVGPRAGHVERKSLRRCDQSNLAQHRMDAC